MKEKFSGYRMVVAAFVYMFAVMGALYVLAIFMPSICEATGYSIAQITVMYTFAGVSATVVSMLITPTAIKKLGERICILISVVIVAGHLFWYSAATQLWELYVAATLGGIALGLGGFAACNSLIANWFIEKRAKMTGVVMAAALFGNAALQALCGSLIEAAGYRIAYRIVVAIVAVVGIIVVLIVRNKPSDIGQKPLGYENIAQSTKEEDENVELPGLTVKEAMKTASFWLAFLGFAFASLAIVSCENMFATLFTTEGYTMSISSAAFYSALYGLVAAAVTFVNGFLVEKLRYTKYIIISGIVGAAGALILGLTGPSIVNMGALIVVAMVCVALTSPRYTADCATAAESIFGLKDFGSIQAYFVGVGNVASMIMAGLIGVLYGMGLNMAGCFVAFGVIGAIGSALLVIAGAVSPLKKK